MAKRFIVVVRCQSDRQALARPPNHAASRARACAPRRFGAAGPREWWLASEESARAIGIEPQQHQALLAIKGFPERDRMTIGELAERLQIKHHSAVELAGRLVANGLAARELDAADRRQVYLTLSPHGEAVLAQLTATHREELRRMGPELRALLGRLSDGTE